MRLNSIARTISTGPQRYELANDDNSLMITILTTCFDEYITIRSKKHTNYEVNQVN